MQTNLTLASTVAKHSETHLFQFLGNLKNLSHLCRVNHINKSIHAKKYSSDIEAAHGCKSRDLSTFVDVVDGDCLFFIHFKLFVMSTTKVNAATPVAEIPTQAAMATKQLEVDQFKSQLTNNLASGQREYYRNLWGKARAEQSRMQTLYYFARKEASHATY